jgi:hypothetical protein
MKPEREMAVAAMQNMGWTAKRLTDRKHPRWQFDRPDTGGLWDSVSVPQADLSLHWVAQTAMRYGDADDLLREIKEAQERWIRSRFLGIFKSAEGGDA